MIEPVVRIHSYEVVCDVKQARVRPERLIVKHLGDNVWVVGEEGAHYFLNAEDEPGYRSSPERRFDLETAQQVAKDLVRKRVADALAWIAEREAGA